MTRWLLNTVGPFLLLGALLIGGGCSNPADPLDCVPAGQIMGKVDNGGDPKTATIRATSVTDPGVVPMSFRTTPGPNGYYYLDLPAGRYTLKLEPNWNSWSSYDYAASGLGYGQIEPDTLTVNAETSPLRIDFKLGALFLKLDLSSKMDGEGIRVTLDKRDGIPTENGRTYVNQIESYIEDGEARIELFGVLPGEYRVKVMVGPVRYLCDCPNDSEFFWMPGVRDEEEASWFEVIGGATTILHHEFATEPARIEGRVSGAWLSMGMSDLPEVAVVGVDSVSILQGRRVSADGRFSMNVHFPQPVKILVSQGGVDQWIGGPGFEGATIFDLQHGETISNIELVQSGMRLEVRGEKSISIYDSEIQIHDPTDMTLLAKVDFDESSDSPMGIANLWPGEYLLYFTPRSGDRGSFTWRPQWYDRAPEPEFGQVITLGPSGDVAQLDVALEKGGALAGQIIYSTEDPSPNHILVTPADDKQIWGGSFYSWRMTSFLVRGLPDGDFKIGIYPAYQDWQRGDPIPEGTIWYPGTTDWNAAGVVTIEDAAEIDDIVIDMD